MRRTLIAVSCLLAAVSIAHADGIGPQRKMTETEAAAYGSVRAGVRSALPQLPGYSLTFDRVGESDEGMVPKGLGAGEMFRMTYHAVYSLDATAQAQQDQAALMDQGRGTPAQQKRAAELNAKDAALTQARDRSRSAAEKQRIRAELKAVRTELDQLNDEIAAGAKAFVEGGGAAAAMKRRDDAHPARELSVWVWINADVSVSDRATPFTLAGVPLALEQSGGCQEYDGRCPRVRGSWRGRSTSRGWRSC